MQKLTLFQWFVLEICLIKKNPAIWLAENVLANILGTKFSQKWDLCRNTANNINLHYRTNPVKIYDQIFQKIQKTLFWAHFWYTFLIFGAKTIFLENPAPSLTVSNKFLAPCQNSEKTNDTIPRKHPDRRKDGRMDKRMEEQTPYFKGPFQLLLGVQ